VWATKPHTNFCVSGTLVDEYVLFSDFIQVSVNGKVVSVVTQLHHQKEEQQFQLPRAASDPEQIPIFPVEEALAAYNYIRSFITPFCKIEAQMNNTSLSKCAQHLSGVS
jgi:hypothetical protein